MANYVIQATESTIKRMEQYYNSYITGHLPAGALFVAKKNGCTITAYRSGKVLFQGKEAEKEAQIWSIPASQQPTLKEQNTSSSRLSIVSAVGSDEVGTGDYFGPIVVVAAYVAKEQISSLAKMGVKDSKQLTDEAICRLAPLLMEKIEYEQAVLSNHTYNQWQQNGMPQTKIKALLHNEAIKKLVQKLAPASPEAIIIDQFIERDRYFLYLEGERHVIRDHVYCIPKAETVHIAVAAASIIARYLFLHEMDKLSEQMGMNLPKGAGEHVDRAAASLIQTHGEASLEACAKLHFANTEKAKQIAMKFK
ncbi:ribonuclease HIII [Anoxybacillus rupiensis]|uniref:Ribonuclease HIII n=1 Tax=Anoxybacteroides rupiense TaxID=311460 RepID=A0ABT5W0M9_9BACL|nr:MULTISPECIES: ribonuclease HIII [Anoxybacillus]MBB3907116.1 ribonuclease HIII [Anoxybacillus rupiensis]MBS2772003.1 ribonuclease HIII [Anoxybacillus rupiensis]MDE8562888.1 ribonuclease HIII [Anoxybacillus rupiensis]QHC05014.1 ribonuclease HIII [Anoxybacillus sp. PDR2]